MRIVELTGSPDLPEKNFVAVDADIPHVGLVRVIGVVIRYNQRADYIRALPDALAQVATARTVLAGDFNLSMIQRSWSRTTSVRPCASLPPRPTNG